MQRIENAQPQRPLRVLVPVGSNGLGGSELALLRLMDACPRGEIEFTCWVFQDDAPADATATPSLSANGPCDASAATAPGARGQDSRGSFSRELDERGISWRSFARGRLRSPWGLVQLGRQLRRESPDVIYLHASRAIAWLARGARIPCLERINMPRARGAGGWCRFALIDRLCSNLNTRVLPVSEDLARDLRARGVAPEKILVLRDFIEPERFRALGQRAEARAELRLAPDARVVLNMGRMTPEKAQEDFLHLAVRLGAHDRHWQFILAGEGPLRRTLERQVSDLGIYRRCQILPFRRDVASLLAAADVYVQTSRWEGLATVILEAMAAGLPIAATDVGGTREALAAYPEHRLVAPGDTEAMLAAVEELWACADVRAGAAAPCTNGGAPHATHSSRASIPFPNEFTREAVCAHFVQIVREAAGPRES